MPIPTLRRSLCLLMSALLLAVLSAFAAESPAPASAASTPSVDQAAPQVGYQGRLTAAGLMQMNDLLMLSPGAAWYPESDAATGAQGTALVVMNLTADGQVAKARIVRSTQAATLDQQALRLASQLHWMGARKTPSQASLQVQFSRDSIDSVQKKTCAELNQDVTWLKAHRPAEPPENVGALRIARNLVSFNTSWMPDRHDREAGKPVRDALFLASRRTIDECVAQPDKLMKDVFNHLLHEASKAGEIAPASPVAVADDAGPLPRSILHTQRDEPVSLGSVSVTRGDTDYPQAALTAGAQGEVEVRAELDDAGMIERVLTQSDRSGSPTLANAAQEVMQRRWTEAQLVKKDPATWPVAIVMTVDFKRDDTDSIPSLDCSTYRLDATAWRGRRLQLPDFQSLTAVLGMRAMGLISSEGRQPQRGTAMFKDKDRLAEMKALDEACDAAPQKLAIDALIDVIDAMPAPR
jgi:TonB family protein